MRPRNTRIRPSLGLGGWIAVFLLVAIAVVAVVAPIIGHDAAIAVNTDAISRPPSAEHVLGTDGSGRDVLARTLVATRLSILLAVIATLLGALLGIALGALPAALGPRAESFSGAVISTWLAFPALMLALLITIMIGPGVTTGVIAIALTVAPMFARLMQTLSSEVVRTDYVAAARLLGVTGSRLLVRYVMPNVAEPVVVYVLTSVGGGLLALASLSFLGLGVQAPEFDWGRMLGDGLSTIYTNPWTALAPGIAIVIAGITFALVGDAAARLFRGTGELVASRVARRVPPPTVVPDTPSRAMDDSDAVLVSENLTVHFPTGSGWIAPVRDFSLRIGRGEIVGLVGESGSGKSVTAHALADLIHRPGSVRYDRLEVAGKALNTLQGSARRRHLRRNVGFVFQDPSASLNPALSVGRQLLEAVDPDVAEAAGMSPREVAIDQLARLQIPDPERLLRQYPPQLSGGMRQRVLLAMARMNSPVVILADEPTTALDVTVQQHFLSEISAIARHDGVAIMVVSHDLGALVQIADRIVVMYAGRIVEEVSTADLTSGRARHPYTRGLYEAVPSLDHDPSERLASIPGTPPQPVEVADMLECPFIARCGYATAACQVRPVLEGREGGALVACHNPIEIGPRVQQEVRS